MGLKESRLGPPSRATKALPSPYAGVYLTPRPWPIGVAGEGFEAEGEHAVGFARRS